MISEWEGTIMDDMQFAKYAADIREILEKTDQESLENLVRNAVAYAHSNNNSKTSTCTLSTLISLNAELMSLAA